MAAAGEEAKFQGVSQGLAEEVEAEQGYYHEKLEA